MLGARYPDLETRDFLARVCDSVVRVASPYRADDREIRDTIRERVRVRPSAFRITKGPHPEALDVDDGVRVVYAFVITPDGLPTQDEVSRYAALWWELDSTETHELALVVVDSDGHETLMDMPRLAIGLDVVRFAPRSGEASPEGIEDR